MLESGDDELFAALGRVALGKKILELRFGRGVRAFENHVHDFAFALAPGRLVADEIPKHQRIILALRALRIGRLIDAGGEIIGIDVGQAEEHRRPIGVPAEHDSIGPALSAGGHAPGFQTLSLARGGGISRGGRRVRVRRCGRSPRLRRLRPSTNINARADRQTTTCRRSAPRGKSRWLLAWVFL